MLLSVASIKDAWVAEMWEQIEEGGCWSMRFVKQIHDWELGNLEAFFKKLQAQLICNGLKDEMIWYNTNCGNFSVKFLYSSFSTDSLEAFLASTVWSTWVPVRVGSYMGENFDAGIP